MLFFLLSAFSFFAAPAEAFTIQIDNGNNSIQAWNNNEITFDVNYTDCLALGLTSDKLDGLVDTAFALWNSTPATNLKLIRGDQVTKTVTQILAQTGAGNPLIICDAKLGHDLADPGKADIDVSNIPAVTQLLRVDGSRHIALAVVYINADGTKPANAKNVLRIPNLLSLVFAHEIGHALGLGHSADTHALMYYDATAKNELSLAQDDMDGITYLYPRKELSNSKVFGCSSMSMVGGAGPGNSGSSGGRSHGQSPGSGSGLPMAAEFLAFLMVCAIGVGVGKRKTLAIPFT